MSIRSFSTFYAQSYFWRLRAWPTSVATCARFWSSLADKRHARCLSFRGAKSASCRMHHMNVSASFRATSAGHLMRTAPAWASFLHLAFSGLSVVVVPLATSTTSHSHQIFCWIFCRFCHPWRSPPLCGSTPVAPPADLERGANERVISRRWLFGLIVGHAIDLAGGL